MKITLIIQDEPLYPAHHIKYLIQHLHNHEIVSCVLTDFYPYGKKESFFRRLNRLIGVYGYYIVARYLLRFVYYKVFKIGSIPSILSENKIPIIKINTNINSKASIKKIHFYKPDLIVSVTSTDIFKKELIQLAPKGCINLHCSLLPSYRGLQPAFWILKNKEKEAGATVFFINEGVDTGNIITQRKFVVPSGITHRGLLLLSKMEGAKALIQAIDDIANDNVNIIASRYESSYYSFQTNKDVKEFKESGLKFF